MTGAVRLCLAVLLAIALGCSGGPAARTRYYTLGSPAGEAVTGVVGGQPAVDPEEGLSVGVDSFVVDPPYDQERLVYRAGEDSVEIGFYEYHRWAAPLSRMAATALAEGLRGTPGIAVIEPTSSGASYDVRLGGRLVYLEEVDRPGGQEVRVALDLELRDSRGHSIWRDRLVESSKVDVDSVPEIAEEARILFERLVEEARSRIAAALSTE